jgi:nitrite reductase/ring-hydroxylating ferredoxin subunit
MSFVEVMKVNELAAGSMKHVEAGGKEILVANVNGKYYAVSDRCGHQSSRLSMGKQRDNIVTCPLHFSRFDVTTGKKLTGPVEQQIPGFEKCPESVQKYAMRVVELMAPVKTYDLPTFQVRVEEDSLQIEV